MDMVTLKNGDMVPQTFVPVGLISLKTLMSGDPIAFYELVMICRDENHALFGGAVEKLRSLALIDYFGKPHQFMRSLVLSAVEGEELAMRICSPYTTDSGDGGDVSGEEEQ